MASISMEKTRLTELNGSKKDEYHSACDRQMGVSKFSNTAT